MAGQGVNKSQKFLNSIFLFSAIFLLLLTGCSKQRDIKILQNLHSRPFDFEEEKEDAKVGIKVLSEKEFSSTFPTAPARRKKQVYKDYKIMLVDFANKSDYLSYLIDPKNIGFSFTKAEEIFAKLKIDNSYSFASYTPLLIILSSIGIITTFIALTSPFGILEGTLFFVIAMIYGSIIIIPALLAGFFGHKKLKKQIEEKNKHIFKSLKQKIFDFDQTEELGPNTIINKLFFVNKKDLKPEFSIKLFNEIQQSYLEFNIPYLTQLACK